MRFRTTIEEAKKIAQILTGEDPALVLKWMTPTFAPTVITHDEDEPEEIAKADLPDGAAMVESDITIANDDLEDSDDDEEIVEKALAQAYMQRLLKRGGNLPPALF